MTTDADVRSDGLDQRVELDIAGMTCAACASRIEKKLNKMGGVVATVNYATERAVLLGLGGVVEQPFTLPSWAACAWHQVPPRSCWQRIQSLYLLKF